MSNAFDAIELKLVADPHLARLVRMTAANVAMLSSMSVDKVEDLRMAAEEAFIYACSLCPQGALTVSFAVDATGVRMDFTLSCDSFCHVVDGDPAAYADVILSTVCDVYTKAEAPASLHIEIGADV